MAGDAAHLYHIGVAATALPETGVGRAALAKAGSRWHELSSLAPDRPPRPADDLAAVIIALMRGARR